MNTFPVISHHLFVSAAGQSRRADLKAWRAAEKQPDAQQSGGGVQVETGVNGRDQETARPLRVLNCATAS